MATDIEQELIEKVRALPPEKQQQALEYLESLTAKAGARESELNQRPIWEVIQEISSQVPIEEWEKLPSDGSINVDHYLYGAPKRQP